MFNGLTPSKQVLKAWQKPVRTEDLDTRIRPTKEFLDSLKPDPAQEFESWWKRDGILNVVMLARNKGLKLDSDHFEALFIIAKTQTAEAFAAGVSVGGVK